MDKNSVTDDSLTLFIAGIGEFSAFFLENSEKVNWNKILMRNLNSY